MLWEKKNRKENLLGRTHNGQWGQRVQGENSKFFTYYVMRIGVKDNWNISIETVNQEAEQMNGTCS